MNSLSPPLPLHIALVLSLVFHLAIYTAVDWLGLHAPPPPAPRPVIEALLVLPADAAPPPAEALPPPEAPAEDLPSIQPALPAAASLPASAPAAAPPPPASPKAVPPPVRKSPAVLAYPLEAVRRGLEGETLVRVRLDAAGTIVAVGLERSSGHPILDAAALRAARGLQTLPESAQNMEAELSLPVRFRLQ